MPLTLDVIAGVIEASPHGRAACRALGWSPAQAAYSLLEDLAATRDEGVRDGMVGEFFDAHGIYGVKSQADADTFLDELVQRNTGELRRLEGRPFAERYGRDEQIAHFARESQKTPTTWTRADIQRVADVATRSALASGLAARMRASDARHDTGRPEIDPKYREAIDDRRSLRETLERGWNALERNPRERTPEYAAKAREDFTMRDHLEHAHDTLWVENQIAAAEADPLEDAREGVNLA